MNLLKEWINSEFTQRNRNHKKQLIRSEEYKTEMKYRLDALASVADFVGIVPQTKRSTVQFPVRAHTWVAGSVPVVAHTEGSQLMILYHTNVSLPCFLPCPSKLKILWNQQQIR